MDDIKKVFGDRVKEIRSAQDLSQETLALKAGLQPSQIGYIERGERECRLETIGKLATALQVTVSELTNFDVPYTIDETASDDVTDELAIFMKLFSKKERDDIYKIIKILYGWK